MATPTAVAVVVTYNPDFVDLQALLERLTGMVMRVVVVDNGSLPSPEALVRERACHWLPLGDNLGIAAAQNQGIALARSLGATAVVLFDQDSLPEAGMIDTLADVAEALSTSGVPVAAVGPSYYDDGLGKGAPEFHRPDVAAVRAFEVDHVIASGSYIPIAVLDRVGGMREELFIDYVDIEWALRARTCGLRSFCARDALMRHQFGVPAVVMGRRYSAHSPMRQYYLFRNSIWLWRQGWVPLSWKLRRGPALILRLGFNLLFARPIAAQWRMIWRGVWHGMTGRMGRGHG